MFCHHCRPCRGPSFIRYGNRTRAESKLKCRSVALTVATVAPAGGIAWEIIWLIDWATSPTFRLALT
jgi:hypothetical protein